VPLEKIKRLVGSRDFDVLSALEPHRSALQAAAQRIRRLIRTVDVTTQHLKGKVPMSHPQLFGGFSDEEQQKMADGAAQRWDADTVRASNARWKQYPPEKRQRILDEGNTLHSDLISAMPEGSSSPKVQAIIARWHAHMQDFWSPNDEQLLGLADLYNADLRFRANYEAMQPGLAAFMREAVREYVEHRKQETREAYRSALLVGPFAGG
jgi:hypothetical protein